MPVLSPAREPNRCEYTSVPTAAIVPARFEFVPRQPGSKSGEPVSTRFSTASVLRRAGIGWPNAFSRSGRTAAADQRLFVAARPRVLPADVACTIRSSRPAEPRTSCAQSDPSSCAWRSGIGTSGPRLVFTTTRPVRAFASWMIRMPVICVGEADRLDHVQRRRRGEHAGDVPGRGAVGREARGRDADDVVAVLVAAGPRDQVAHVVRRVDVARERSVAEHVGDDQGRAVVEADRAARVPGRRHAHGEEVAELQAAGGGQRRREPLRQLVRGRHVGEPGAGDARLRAQLREQRPRARPGSRDRGSRRRAGASPRPIRRSGRPTVSSASLTCSTVAAASMRTAISPRATRSAVRRDLDLRVLVARAGVAVLHRAGRRRARRTGDHARGGAGRRRCPCGRFPRRPSR